MHTPDDTIQRVAAEHQARLRAEAEVAHRATRSSALAAVARWLWRPLARPPATVPPVRPLTPPTPTDRLLDERHPPAAA